MSVTQSLLEQFKSLPVLLNPGDCAGKTYIVTGSNIGLGYETVKHLVRCSASRVILGVRNVKAGEKAKAEIETATGRTGVMDVWHLDLGSFESVKSFANKAIMELDRIDALVENAAVALDKWSTAEGMETSITVNVLSTILLGAMLMPKLTESGRRHSFRPRLVFVGATLGFAFKDELTKCDRGKIFEGLNDPNRTHINDRYSLSKLVHFYAVRQFAATFPVEETGVIVNLISPGLCSTGLARDNRASYRALLETSRAIIARTAEQGSRTILHGIVADEDSHGKLLSGCKTKDYWTPEWVKNEAGQKMQLKIWGELVDILEETQPGVLKQ